jgi:hypothetical protein
VHAAQNSTTRRLGRQVSSGVNAPLASLPVTRRRGAQSAVELSSLVPSAAMPQVPARVALRSQTTEERAAFQGAMDKLFENGGPARSVRAFVCCETSNHSETVKCPKPLSQKVLGAVHLNNTSYCGTKVPSRASYKLKN